MSEALGIWAVRSEAEALAVKLQANLGGEIYRPWLQQDVAQKTQFALAYRSRTQWVVIGASGIAVRFLDGLAQDKHTDPAVVVLDEAGRHAISLLAGHEGGANRLAYLVANIVGAVPVISTATEALKPLVLGIGCRKGASVEQVESAVHQALGDRSLSEVREVATVDIKAEEAGVLAFCECHELPLRVISTSVIAARPWVTKPSEWVRQNVGLEGVCEPCALIASPRGKLIVPKTALDGVTVAVVEDRLDYE